MCTYFTMIISEGKMLLLLLMMMLSPCVLGEPHLELEEGDSPCLHKPCHHGVCVETNSLATGYKCFCQGSLYARK